jgi:type III pantothenate kinase
MLIGVKIGNSTFKTVEFENPENNNFSILYQCSLEKLDWIALGRIIKFKTSAFKTDCIICSVVPYISERFFSLFKDKFNRIFNINSKLRTGLLLKVNNPEKFGSDRLACCLSAYELFKENIAIVDVGTATTITVVTKNGEILGGTIMPGIEMMNYSLHEKTALLPIVNLSDSVYPLGNDTDSAIRSGIILGTIYGINGIIKEIEKFLDIKLKIILTGGNAELIEKHIKFPYDYLPHLVFEGMRLIYLKNIKN